MGRDAAIVVVIVLLGCTKLSGAIEGTCDLFAVVGQTMFLPFFYEGLTNSHGLKWTHNSMVVFSRQGSVTKGKVEDINKVGSLVLRNLQLSGAGTYQATVLHSNNTVATTWTSHLCVMDPVTKPTLTYVCDFRAGVVTLNCNVGDPRGLVFSWTLDKNALPSETRQTLSVALGQLRGGSFACGADNKASKAGSDGVRPACRSPSPSPAAPVCLPFTMFVAVLAGGGGLVLVLLIVITVLCCRCKHTETRTGKMELRMSSLTKPEPGSVAPDYETMQAIEDYPSPSPKPSPRAGDKNAPRLEGQSENRTMQLPTVAVERKASPVPKPRTKITPDPQTSECASVVVSGANGN